VSDKKSVWQQKIIERERGREGERERAREEERAYICPK